VNRIWLRMFRNFLISVGSLKAIMLRRMPLILWVNLSGDDLDL